MRRGFPVDKIISVAVFIALEVFCVVLISNNGSVQHSRIAGVVRDVNVFFDGKRDRLHEYANLRQENEKLAEENAMLRSRVDILTAFAEQSRVTDSALLSFQGRFSYTPARVINNTVNRQHNFLILDKGTEDGISEGMGVITSIGVIGIVSVCDTHYCKVTSLLDTDMRISGKLLKDNVLGLISWNGVSTTSANMTELPTHTDINPGDTVVTSGYSAIFPQGIPVGTIGTAKSDGVSVVATLKLFEDFHSLQNVYIVNDADMAALKKLEERK